MSNFEVDLEKARENKKRGTVRAFALSVLLLLTALFAYAYFFSVKIVLVLNEPAVGVNTLTSSGTAINFGTYRYFPLSKNISVSVSASGYKTKVIYLNKANLGSKLNVSLDYEDVPVSISTNLTTNDAKWYLDNLYSASGANFEQKIQPGTYRLGVTAKHYSDFSQTVVVASRVGYSESIKLNPIVVPFQIETKPAGGRVFINDRLIGKTPVSGDLNSGSVEIKVLMDGYRDISETVDLSLESDHFVRKYMFKSAQKRLLLSYSPEGGRLYVDGLEVPVHDFIVIDKIGETSIRYSKQGYANQSYTVSSSDSKLALKLEPEYGSATIQANVQAKVYLEGDFIGTTPITRKFLAKKHSLKLVKPGYVTQKLTLDVMVNTKQRVSAKLKTLSEHYLEKSTAEMISSNGMHYKRFSGKQFDMGAPRYERGQRANEILRTVDFKRAFYISKKEVSNSAFSAFKRQSGISNHPVTGISWDEAALYCNWLSLREGLAPFYKTSGDRVVGFNRQSRGYRMPSEAEWEYVAKYADKSSPSIFVWGDDYASVSIVGNIADKSADGSVKKFLADYSDGIKGVGASGRSKQEPSGLFDFSGNVSEWVHDVYSIKIPLKGDVYVDYLGPAVGSSHVIKGSNFASYNWTELRASFREFSDVGRSDVGFRLARYIN